MSVEILEKEILIRIPKEQYNSKVQMLIDELESPKESSLFFDVEEGSEMEKLLLEIKQARNQSSTKESK